MKPNITRIINKIKSGVKIDKVMNKIKAVQQPIKPIARPVTKSDFKVRDMRHEAIDMGSHGAKEFFGDKDDSSNR